MKRILLIALLISLLGCMICVKTSAEEWCEYTYEHIEGGVEIKKYKGTDTIVEIPSEIYGSFVISMGQEFFGV